MDETKLKVWRRRERLTLEELSALTGFSAMMLNLAERGRRNFSTRGKVLIARRLGVSLRDLFEVEQIDEKEMVL